MERKYCRSFCFRVLQSLILCNFFRIAPVSASSVRERDMMPRPPHLSALAEISGVRGCARIPNRASRARSSNLPPRAQPREPTASVQGSRGRLASSQQHNVRSMKPRIARSAGHRRCSSHFGPPHLRPRPCQTQSIRIDNAARAHRNVLRPPVLNALFIVDESVVQVSRERRRAEPERLFSLRKGHTPARPRGVSQGKRQVVPGVVPGRAP